MIQDQLELGQQGEARTGQITEVRQFNLGKMVLKIKDQPMLHLLQISKQTKSRTTTSNL